MIRVPGGGGPREILEIYIYVCIYARPLLSLGVRNHLPLSHNHSYSTLVIRTMKFLSLAVFAALAGTAYAQYVSCSRPPLLRKASLTPCLRAHGADHATLGHNAFLAARLRLPRLRVARPCESVVTWLQSKEIKLACALCAVLM